ncbi:MAG: tandem-95 repeat protein, partial [Pseudomonadales bacterium]
INSGRDVATFGVTFDFNGTTRPAGASWDVGAFELAGNQKPNVSVGANQNITLPTNSTTITGSATDPDGTIASYLWTKQSGPAVTITNQSTTTVNLADLLEGVYVFRLTATDNEGETGFKEVTITVVDPSVNQAPVANSGGNKTLTLPTNTTVLSGSASDTDGTISTYAWIKVSGPSATLTNAGTATLTVSNLVQGTYVFRLTVTDDDGATGSNDATITVNAAAVNQPPVANAGSAKNLVLPTNSTSLAGSGSDPDGSISSYLWTKQSGPAATLTNANTPTLQLTGLVVGSYVFRLTVTDNNSATAFADVSVNVTASNQAPIANAGSNKTIQLPTNSTTLSGSGSDVDGTISSYAWTKISGPAATLANTNTTVLSLSGLVEGIYVFRLTVTDNNSATGSANVTLTVQAANLPPTASAGTPKTITLPVNNTTLNGSGPDPDGTSTSYLWEKLSGPTATLAGSTTATLSLTNLVVGSYTFRLTVTDNNGATSNSQVAVVVLPAATNQ